MHNNNTQEDHGDREWADEQAECAIEAIRTATLCDPVVRGYVTQANAIYDQCEVMAKALRVLYREVEAYQREEQGAISAELPPDALPGDLDDSGVFHSLDIANDIETAAEMVCKVQMFLGGLCELRDKILPPLEY
jgi:hypothetical protein